MNSPRIAPKHCCARLAVYYGVDGFNRPHVVQHPLPDDMNAPATIHRLGMTMRLRDVVDASDTTKLNALTAIALQQLERVP